MSAPGTPRGTAAIVAEAGLLIGRTAEDLQSFVAYLTEEEWLHTETQLYEASHDPTVWESLKLPAILKLKLREVLELHHAGSILAEGNPGDSSLSAPGSPMPHETSTSRDLHDDVNPTPPRPATNWVTLVDTDSGVPYYYNNLTGASSWTRPPSEPTEAAAAESSPVHRVPLDPVPATAATSISTMLAGSEGTEVVGASREVPPAGMHAGTPPQLAVPASPMYPLPGDSTDWLTAASSPSNRAVGATPTSGSVATSLPLPNTPTATGKAKWQCPSCTYLNHAKGVRCSMCTEAKPLFEPASRPSEDLLRRGVTSEEFATAAFRFVRHKRNGDLKALLGNKVVTADVIDKHGNTLLIVASQNGNLSAAKLLLQTYSADPNAVNWQHNTALHYAKRFGHIDIAELLVLAGAVD